MSGDDQKTLLRILIALLCIGAAVLLVVILTSEAIENNRGDAIETVIVFALVGLVVGAGGNLIVRQPNLAPFGYLTILVGAIALLLTAITIWRENFLLEVSTLDSWAWYMLLGALALGNASILLAGHDDDDADSVKLVRGMTVFALLALFVAVIDEVRISGQRVDPYLLGTLSVFYVLGSLVLPLLGRLTR